MTIVLIIISGCLIIGYGIYIQWVYHVWNQILPLDIPESYIPKTKISVIIPVRNEAEHIRKCITSILDCDYPTDLLELIIIDDHSDDETPEIISNIIDSRIKLLSLSDYLNNKIINAYKKAALQYGIQNANGALIISTDGDSYVKPGFLRTYSYCYETNGTKMMAAPVVFSKAANFIEHFQVLDMASMMGITGAGISRNKYYLANGANLAFDKQAFLDLNPFGLDDKASGDDMFLIQAMAKNHPNKLAFIKEKESIVTTAITHSYKDFWTQRKRWASKSSAYQESNIKWLMVMIFLVNTIPYLSIIVGLLTLNKLLLSVSFMILFFKYLIDYFYLKQMTNYFERKSAMHNFTFAFFFYLVYITFTGIVGLFPSKYDWKNRKVA